MKIVVLMKEVPDTYGKRVIDLATGLTDRAASEAVLDEITERALEAALAYADSTTDCEVVVLTMGRAAAGEALRKALAMGATSGVLVSDAGLSGADLGLTAEVLAAALVRIGFDLIVTGNQSTDGTGGVLPVMLAELLDVPAVTGLSTVSISPSAVSGERASDDATMLIGAALPALVSITDAQPDARLPGFKGIMAAKKRSVETLTLNDLGVDGAGITTPRSIVLAVSPRPQRPAGITITDDGNAGQNIAQFLVDNRLV